MQSLKPTKTIVLLTSIMVLGACQSNKQIENSFNETYLKNSVDLTFSSPNFSALHAPPLMSGFAYVETYEKSAFCDDKDDEIATQIGKVTITRANKSQFSKLPIGNIVANIGYYAIGATGGGLKGNSLYGFRVEPDSKYKITITEARPLVTSYSVSIVRSREDGSQEEVAVADGIEAICTTE